MTEFSFETDCSELGHCKNPIFLFSGRSTAGRKYKRGDGRRFQTIGYDGEVRSPLRERQTNIVATVQRSKSAQNASSSLNNKKAVTKKETSSIFNDKENEIITNVQRSLSLRSPKPNIIVPASLKETIYDVTTPKSEKVKRHLSDRVMTPNRGGRHEAIPFIKDVLASNRTPHKQRVRTGSRKSPRYGHL